MMRVVVASVVLVAGVAFIVIASLGVARMPDVFQRMHAATKAGSIGTALVVLGVLVAGGVARPFNGILTIVFMLLSLSVASQLLARAAYLSGGPIQGLERGNPLEGILDRPPADAAPDRAVDLPANQPR